MPSPDPLVGREIVVSVMDGGAKYRVQSVNRNRTLARLVLVDGGPDGYQDAVLGESCAVSYENVERLVRQRDEMNRRHPVFVMKYVGR
jgi:hypothetical protein